MRRNVVVRVRRWLAPAAVTAVVCAGAALAPAGTAAADTAPPAGLPETASADALPTWQINGVAWNQVVVGDTVYVTGNFSKARPPGTSAGDPAEVTRANLLAYDITTGNLITSFNHSLNGVGWRIVASPDNSRIYVGGDFTTVDGVTRNRIAAFDTATGALVPGFAPSLSSTVRAIAATGSTVYVGGNFFNAGAARTRLAAFNAGTGALLPWAPTADGVVNALAVAPSGTRVIVGGKITQINGQPQVGIGAVDAATGATAPWSSRPTPTPDGNGNYSMPYDMYLDNGVLYVANDGEGGHWFDGRFAADPETGDLIWLDNCYGATYGIYATAGVVYSVGHAHDCGSLGAFPETSPTTWHRALAETAAATGTDPSPPGANGNYSGQPVPTLLHWFPALAPGTVTGKSQAAWTVRGNGDYVALGGEFPRVNGVNQQGLTRFAVKAKAPNKVAPVYSAAALTPNPVSLAPGSARVGWQTTWDYDNEALTYTVSRDGGSTPVYTVTQKSNFWTLPKIGFVDTGLAPGSTHTYRVRVTDPLGNTVPGPTSAPVTISSTAPSAYVSDVTGDGAERYWRLGEPAGATTAYDWAGFDDGTYFPGSTQGTAGALTGDTAASFDGAGFVSSGSAIPGPTTFTVEAWVNTTSTSGGKIVGFGNSPNATSGSYDRHVYMTNDGRILFGVYPGAVRTVGSAQAFNDGQWHHVVASLGGAGMALYVDGKRVGADASVTGAQPYQGYWRIGGDNLGSWTSQPASNYLTGAIDDVAVYPTALSLAQVRQHYTDSGRTVAVPPTPADAYGKAVYDSEPDLYWRLGDAAGATTVTDSSGNDRTGTVGAGVTLGAPGALPAAAGTAAATAGTEGASVVATGAIAPPSAYSTELLFKSTSTAGGKLVGFGAAPGGTSSNYDRHVYLTNDGHLVFGAYTGTIHTITSPGTYTDGQWHHVVATQGPAGMVLYVDGAAVGTEANTGAEQYSGHWRIGGDNLNAWPTQPASNYVAASIDEAAVYSRPLTAAQVAAHWSKTGLAPPPPNQAPTAAATATCTALQCTLSGTGSTDPDGSVAGYAWTFGDGDTGTGATAAHAYPYAGDFTATLTVTDDGGATATASVVVSPRPAANPPTAIAADTFSRTASAGLGTADTGGPWTVSSSTANYSVSGGSAKIAMPTAGVNRYAYLTGVSRADTDARVTLTPDKAPTGGGYQLSVAGRRVAANVEYRARVRVTATGAAFLGVTRLGGTTTETLVGTEVAVPGLTVAAGTAVRVRFQVTGNGPTALRAKAWVATGTEPAAWLVSTTDATAALQAPGQVGVFTYLSGSSTNAPVTVAVDDLDVTATDTPPTAAFTAACTGRDCTVDATGSTDADGPVTYRWSFADGSTATTATATHAYAAAGTYRVTLTVTDSAGATDVTTRTVTVL